MATQAQQIAELQRQMAAIEKQITAETEMRNENHKMITDMHNALMVPQHGQDGKSLLERMAEVTVEIESGKRTANSMLSVAKWLVGIAAAVATLTAAIKWGFNRT